MVDKGLVYLAGEGVLAEVGVGVDQDLLLHAGGEVVLGGVGVVQGMLLQAGEGDLAGALECQGYG